MPYNPEEQKNDILFMGMMCGTDKVIERIEETEQSRTIRECELPRSMKPSQEDFEKLGFEFEEIDGDSVMFKAKLPEGWSIKPEDTYHTDIYDKKGRKRASFFYKGLFYDRTGHMVLYARYVVKQLSFENAKFEDSARVVVLDRDNNSIVKDFGQFPNSWCDEFYNAGEDAYKWLKKQFPECDNPLAYWDD